MKLKHLILFLAVVVAACSSRHPVETRFIASQNDVSPYQQLQAIDSLMWRQPDSALVVLVDFAASPQADSLGEFDGHYFQMLLSELLYKNDCEQTNREELLTAVDYFDSIVTTDDRDAMNRVSTDEVHEAIKKTKNNMSHFLLIGAKIVKFHQKEFKYVFSESSMPVNSWKLA